MDNPKTVTGQHMWDDPIVQCKSNWISLKKNPPPLKRMVLLQVKVPSGAIKLVAGARVKGSYPFENKDYLHIYFRIVRDTDGNWIPEGGWGSDEYFGSALSDEDEFGIISWILIPSSKDGG